MVKTKKTNSQFPLVITGYILFALLVIAVLLSTTIPFGRMLFTPNVLHDNVALLAIALTVGALLPAFLGYMIGDHSVRSKTKLSHHFNGMLFGLLAFWLMTLLSVLITIPNELFAEYNTRIILINLIPSIGIAMITTILTIAHVRSSQAKQDILEYKPFSVILTASIVALPLWSLVNNIVTNSVSLYSFVSPAIVAALGLVSYASLRGTRLSNYGKVVWSAVSLSVVFMMTYVSSQLVYTIAGYLEPRPTMEAQVIVGWVGFILAFAAWIIYWSKQVKTLR